MVLDEKIIAIRPRVLIVEDEWLVAEDFHDILNRAGYDIVGPAHDGERASALIDSETITAALLDVNLGGNTSYVIAEKLRMRGIPYAFVTGYDAIDLPSEAAGRIVVNKPVRDDTLREVVSNLVAAG